LINAGLWVGSALACVFLYLVQAPESSLRAVAVVQRHPVVVPQGGRLATLGVEVGSSVEAGQALGTVEVPGLAQDLVAAQAELSRLQATVGVDPERTRRFAKDASSSQARWMAARVALESQRATLVARELELGRLQAPGAAVPALEIEQAQAGRDALKTEIRVREEELAVLKAAWEAASDRASAGADPVLEAQVQAAEARVGAIRERLEAGVLRAPAAGVVSAISQSSGGSPGLLPSPGTWLPGGVAALAIVEAEAHEAVVYLPPVRARTLDQGAPVTLEGADGHRIAARVVGVSPSVESVPARQLTNPEYAEWAVPVHVRTVDAVLVPGDSFAVNW
jgi:multidrug efflux pump subunit AcrA (membrane-fusion protein)